MPHHSFAAADTKYRGYIRSDRWSVCVGAGISAGIVPTWIDFTRAVFAKATGQSLSRFSFRRLANRMGWGLDAWLQAGLNAMILQGKSREEFTALIEDELYRDLLSRADAAGQRDTMTKALVKPRSNKPRQSLELLRFLQNEFGGYTLFTLARWLRKAAAKDLKNPLQAVLTFNADGLLDMLLTLLAAEEHLKKPGQTNYPKDEFKRVLRASDDSKEVIPIYHLHGCIVPKSAVPDRRQESRASLIFPESGYSRMSSTVFTWQQTIFLSHAQSQRLVFIGLSMSDPNLRRWLSWCTTNAAQEQRDQDATPREEYILDRHLWITARPRERKHESALESSLLHLGVRIAWLDSWNQLSPALNNLLGLD